MGHLVFSNIGVIPQKKLFSIEQYCPSLLISTHVGRTFDPLTLSLEKEVKSNLNVNNTPNLFELR